MIELGGLLLGGQEHEVMPKLFRVIVPVADIEGAARFYEKILNLRGQRVSPGRHYFDCEGTVLACYDPKADGDDFDAKPIPEPVYLSVDDLETTFRSGERRWCQVLWLRFSQTWDL